MAALRAAWAPIAVLLLHEVLARRYGHDPYVDPAMHFLGGMAVAYWFYRVIKADGGLLGDLKDSAVYSVIIGATAIVAFLWEFAEYIHATVRLGKSNTTPINILSDQFLGLLGAAILIVILVLKKRSE